MHPLVKRRHKWPLYMPRGLTNGWEPLTGYVGCPCRLMGQSYGHNWLMLSYANGGAPPQNGARTCVLVSEQ